MANKESSSSIDSKNASHDVSDTLQRPQNAAFSIAQALSMVRQKREQEERAKQEEEQALEEQRKEKAKEKRQRRRKNQKVKKATLRAEVEARQLDNTNDEPGANADEHELDDEDNSTEDPHLANVERSHDQMNDSDINDDVDHGHEHDQRPSKRKHDDVDINQEISKLPVKKRLRFGERQANPTTVNTSNESVVIEQIKSSTTKTVTSFIPRALLVKRNKR